MNKILFLVLLSMGSFSTLASSPSFDCNKASGAVERLICQDDELASLDRTMATVYQQALKNIPVEEQPKAMQRGWIKGRNDCWKAQSVRECAMQNYQSRIIELKIQGGLLEVPASTLFDCEDFPAITAVFYTQLDPVTAVFSFDEQQLLATNVPSGSGARYQGANFEFWEHHGEASVRYFDQDSICKLR
ncbi:MliC family protein [Shewanella gelidimarina]|uniref:MliC family protein n=1 Tax=Shewanella gelidimarina TaxID=56813 RepID=UPI00200C0D79|nr:MliC family protein [Shewanella gelidimarina]MCL1058378.1 MliC family protein [Shewanella gelidimarina]